MKQYTLIGLSLAGLSFSGYLSGVKLLGEACAFNETCPTFLGYPTCYYGFVMFLLITVFVVLLRFSKMSVGGALKSVLILSGLGMCFAGYYTFRELPKIFDQGAASYVLGLPTCAYGFIVYVAIVMTTALLLREEK